MGGRGRGKYYKNKYGGGRAGRGRGGSAPPEDAQPRHRPPAQGGGTSQDLQQALLARDGRPYPAYHDVEGVWAFSHFSLSLDRAQSDPYAAPSRFRVLVPASVAGFPPELWQTRVRRTALADLLTRTFGAAVSSAGADIRAQGGGWQGEKGGDMDVDTPGQHVLERTSVTVAQGSVEARFTIGLPARGRSILGQQAARILVDNLPRYVQKGLLYASLDPQRVQRHVECAETGEALRGMLPGLGLVAFIADGSILPRASGASDAPMPREQAVPFVSPPSLAVEVTLPHRGRVRGLGIRQGVTLIVGGGFHGKSTLLEAIELGCYNKVPGDGRELIATDPSACKIRSEDGRRVATVDISPYISNLPYGRDTTAFCTDDGSGSTSQAAAIQEALEVGCRCLMMDEDTCATNLMQRDLAMQALVAKEKEPITPFIEHVRALSGAGVSTVLVVGGSGAFFGVADTVLCMEAFVPRDVTSEARDVHTQFSGSAPASASQKPYTPPAPRIPTAICPGRPKVSTRHLHLISFGDVELGLGAVEQLVERSQTRAVAEALQHLQARLGGHKPLHALLAELDALLDEQGLDALTGGNKLGNLARPRMMELAAALNRLRSAELTQQRRM